MIVCHYSGSTQYLMLLNNISFQAYEVKSKTYRGTLYDDDDDDEDDEEKPIQKKNQTMAQAVQRKVRLHPVP